jgi:hypothetical protein
MCDERVFRRCVGGFDRVVNIERVRKEKGPSW